MVLGIDMPFTSDVPHVGKKVASGSWGRLMSRHVSSIEYMYKGTEVVNV
jgi:hypothetical protein